jgi:septation ring formation regulator EzrA
MNMKTSPNDVSNQEILGELKKLHASDEGIKQELKKLSDTSIETKAELEKLSTKFDGLENKFGSLEGRFDEMGEAMQVFASNVDKRFDSVESEMQRMNAVAVTKGYLDDKLANLHSDIIQQTRKECVVRIKEAGLRA